MTTPPTLPVTATVARRMAPAIALRQSAGLAVPRNTLTIEAASPYTEHDHGAGASGHPSHRPGNARRAPRPAAGARFGSVSRVPAMRAPDLAAYRRRGLLPLAGARRSRLPAELRRRRGTRAGPRLEQPAWPGAQAVDTGARSTPPTSRSNLPPRRRWFERSRHRSRSWMATCTASTTNSVIATPTRVSTSRALQGGCTGMGQPA